MRFHGALVRTDVSEERIASIDKVARTGELGTLAATGKQRAYIPEYGIIPRVFLLDETHTNFAS
jgi:hypothetical protein